MTCTQARANFKLTKKLRVLAGFQDFLGCVIVLWSSACPRRPVELALWQHHPRVKMKWMQMKLDWSIQTVGEWREWLQRVPRSNCMQTWPYAKAVRQSDQKVTRLGLIRIDEEPVGLLAIQEVKLGPIHIVSLFRGPLWFVEEPNPESVLLFAQKFDEEFPRRLFRRRRWLPEWQSAPSFFSRSPFKARRETYATAWVDLRPDSVALRRQLDQKWRNALNKSERSGLELVQDDSGKYLDQFVKCYIRDKWQKRYHGPSGRFITEEFLAARPFGDGILLLARYRGNIVAGIFILKHGRSASYRVGWTTEEGRATNAHNYLLWNALLICKQNGCENLDLGGLHTTGDTSLNRFKLGLGSEIFETPGMLS